VPRSVTPESLRAEADALDAEIERLREEATDLRRLADRMEERAGEALSSGVKSVTNETMNATGIVSAGAKRRPGVKPKAKGPVGSVAAALGLSVVDLAKKIGESYASMRTWNVRGRVPDDVAKKLADLVDAHHRARKKTG
jgi:DNA-binding transcriptional regulator YiaG